MHNIIKIYDDWWKSFRTENANYYQEVDLDKMIFHLCGSRARLAMEYNERYPETPFNLQSNVYMFTSSGIPIHVWLIVKIRDGKIILHKHAVGHEIVRVLEFLTNLPLMKANDYNE